MTSLKHTFDKNAAEYRRFRPEYPGALADAIVRLSNLQHGARILEIGCGAGQATALFSGLNPVQTSIDIGPRLIEQCRAKFNKLPGYAFVCTSFEDYDGPVASYDLIYAATCFHWITPGVRFTKSSSLLKPGAHLAVFSDEHIKNRDGFFAEVQGCYKKYAPELVPSQEKANEGSLGQGVPSEPEENPLVFVADQEHDRDIRYSADEYVGLLRTFSGHIALGEDRLQSLCACIHSLINQRYDGVILKTLTTKLRVYEKAQQGAQPDAFGAG